MRILMLTHAPVEIGADYWRAYYLGRQMARNGHSVMLVGSPADDEPPLSGQVDGLSVLAMPEGPRFLVGRTGYSPVALFGRLARLYDEEFDLIHTFGHRPVVHLVARWLKRRLRVPQVADWSDLWGSGGIASERRVAGRVTVGLIDHWLEKRNVHNADGVVVVSRFLERRAHALGKTSERVIRLGVGAAIDAIKPMPKSRARTSLALATNHRVFVHSGQSVFDSAHFGAVCVNILELDSESIILLLGGDRRPSNEDINGKRYGRVRQLGHLSQDQMGIALGACDAVLVPLRDRRFNRARMPNRLGDAAAAGRPIVTNPTGDVGRLVEREGLGIVVDEDPSIIAAAVVELATDKESLAKIGRHAREVAETKLSWALLAKKIGSFYEGL